MNMDWYYLSFATDEGFLGGLYIRSASRTFAFFDATARGLNPGGAVKMVGPLPFELFEANVPEGDRNRLLTKEEVQAT